MISHKEAQELHELVGWMRDVSIDDAVNNGFPVEAITKDADRALELAALVMQDTDIAAG